MTWGGLYARNPRIRAILRIPTAWAALSDVMGGEDIDV
jgi:hypothetical protein